MSKIYYVGYYDTVDSNQNREYFSSATNFMNYIAECCSNTNPVEIVSMSHTKNKKSAKGKKIKIKEGLFLKCFYSLGRKNSLLFKQSRYTGKLH